MCRRAKTEGAACALLLVCVSLGASRSFAAAFANGLIGDYPFQRNGSDRLGKSPPFVLTNGDRVLPGLNYRAFFAVTNTPITNGVLYVNGLYEPNGHFVHYLGADPSENLDYRSFTVSLDFYPLPMKRGQSSFNWFENRLNSFTRGRYAQWFGFDPNVQTTDNILTGGYYYRWFSLSRPGGRLTLGLNNHSFSHQFAGARVKPGRWHNLICSVDLRQRRILTRFDGKPLAAIELPADFKLEVMGSAQAAADRQFVFADHSNGSVFFGYAAHLKIFGRALSQPELDALYAACLKERPGFPKTQRLWPQIILTLAVAGLLAAIYRRMRWQAHAAGPKPMENQTGNAGVRSQTPPPQTTNS